MEPILERRGDAEVASSARFIVYNDWDLTGKAAPWVLPLSGNGKPSPVRQSPFNDLRARFSPDGRWLAYSSDESGRPEIYVRSFLERNTKWQISTGGATQPAWRRDGKEVFYLSSTREGYDYLIPEEQIAMMAVEVEAGSTFKAGTPRPLFTTSLGGLPPSGLGNDYVAAGDGQRFLMKTPLESSKPSSITVVLNWATKPTR